MSEIVSVKKTASVEWLRIICAMVVVMFHFEGLYFGGHRYFTHFAIVVDFFFLLSGFLLMKDAVKPRKKLLSLGDSLTETYQFVLHKIKGFYLPYLLAFVMVFILTAVVMAPAGIDAVLERLFHFKWEALLLQLAGFTPDPSFNSDYLVGSAWYLSAMIIAMIPVYYLAVYYQKPYVNVISPLSVLLIYCYIMQNFGTMDVGNEVMVCVMSGVLRGFAGLSLGCICFAVYIKLKENSWSKKAVTTASILEILCYLALPCVVLFRNYIESPDMLFWIFLLAALVVLNFSGNTPISKLLNTRWTSLAFYLGKLSLYIYLFHWFFVLLFSNYFEGLGYWQGQILYCVIVILFSMGMMYIFENLMHRSKQKESRPQKTE
ncbi:hypothetical protein MsAg5_04710 [Methanosarcinaceae archaeon Ag5]|uniref:Acyltransferase 3 domain-containing protein n=1 Tax=Methanolapillus africanus TaxID=3028297 RepID=A0AAE4MJ81_9EURY|nr:hypothetical protein [Methanosarcinaceae archaeon Ag5]